MGGKKIEFTLGTLADSFTDDDASTDLERWYASDGPNVDRTHYYYSSQQQAERRMQNFLHTAVDVLETGSWDNPGKASGKQALVVLINKENKSLFASQLYEDESSILEFSCSCLRNLRAAVGKTNPRIQH